MARFEIDEAAIERKSVTTDGSRGSTIESRKSDRRINDRRTTTRAICNYLMAIFHGSTLTRFFILHRLFIERNTKIEKNKRKC